MGIFSKKKRPASETAGERAPHIVPQSQQQQQQQEAPQQPPQPKQPLQKQEPSNVVPPSQPEPTKATSSGPDPFPTAIPAGNGHAAVSTPAAGAHPETQSFQ